MRAENMKEYHAELQESLDNLFLRETLDKFAVAYRANRNAIFADLNAKDLIAEIAAAKSESISRMDELYEQFSQEAARRGVIVHRVADARAANDLIVQIARDNGCKTIIKSKSMTGEEIHVNRALEGAGYEVVETDLGEWIIQLRHEGPTHMVMPAIHLSRHQVADVFSETTGERQGEDIGELVKVARRELRAKFAQGDMAVSGANFAVADTGTIAICTNEGNGRLVTTLPKVHVAICGLDKLVPTMKDALRIIRVLPRNATGQLITSYVTWMTGATECSTAPDGRKIMHVIFLDNGRSELAKDPVCGEALRCVRCGACANVCPVYRLVGGHKMGYVYIGAIGLILTYFFHGHDKARALVQNCINCEACKDICAAGINLPGIVQEIRTRLNEENGSPLESSLLASVMGNRKLFHTLLRFGKWAQRPVTGGTRFIRHLPDIFLKGQGFRTLPALAPKSFRDIWEDGLQKDMPARAEHRVAVFSGCAQDFIYPEQLEAAITLLKKKNCSVEFPLDQSCCGLPLRMMGEGKTARDVAARNVRAFADGGFDHVLTLCPSCASYMKHNYVRLLEDRPELAEAAEKFTGRMIDFGSYVHDVLRVGEDDLANGGESVCYHSPCHSCRGMGVGNQPRELLKLAGEYKPADEEEVCCGFGGTYSVKFPEVSAQILAKKLDNMEATGADVLVTDCPGCVMQLRGGEEARKGRLKVEHMAEFLARNLR